eukprot:scaffold14690_cov90-Isochrysis_galbana.AAC.1
MYLRPRLLSRSSTAWHRATFHPPVSPAQVRHMPLRTSAAPLNAKRGSALHMRSVRHLHVARHSSPSSPVTARLFLLSPLFTPPYTGRRLNLGDGDLQQLLAYR